MSARTAYSALISLAFAGSAYANPSAGEGAASVSATPLILLAAAFDPKPQNETTISTSKQVKQAFDLIRRGKQAQAVQLFDTVIANSEKHLAGDTRPRFCKAANGADHVSSVRVDPAICDAHFGKGYALIDLGRGDLAEAELGRATTMAPGDAHFANEYAELFKSRRSWQASYDNFARAWSVVDKSTSGPDAQIAARALRGMGFNQAAMGHYDEAEKLYRQSLQYDPKSTIASAELGNISRRKAIGS